MLPLAVLALGDQAAACSLVGQTFLSACDSSRLECLLHQIPRRYRRLRSGLGGHGERRSETPLSRRAMPAVPVIRSRRVVSAAPHGQPAPSCRNPVRCGLEVRPLATVVIDRRPSFAERKAAPDRFLRFSPHDPHCRCPHTLSANTGLPGKCAAPAKPPAEWSPHTRPTRQASASRQSPTRFRRLSIETDALAVGPDALSCVKSGGGHIRKIALSVKATRARARAPSRARASALCSSLTRQRQRHGQRHRHRHVIGRKTRPDSCKPPVRP